MGGEVELRSLRLHPPPPFSQPSVYFCVLLGSQCFGLEQAALPSLAFFPLAHALYRTSKKAKQASKPRLSAGSLLAPSPCMYLCIVLYVYPFQREVCVCTVV